MLDASRFSSLISLARTREVAFESGLCTTTHLCARRATDGNSRSPTTLKSNFKDLNGTNRRRAAYVRGLAVSSKYSPPSEVRQISAPKRLCAPQSFPLFLQGVHPRFAPSPVSFCDCEYVLQAFAPARTPRPACQVTLALDITFTTVSGESRHERTASTNWHLFCSFVTRGKCK